MTKDEFKRLLKAHGYSPLKSEEPITGIMTWDQLHNGWMYKEHQESQVAFWVGNNDSSIYISIKEMDASLEYITDNLQIVNIFLTLFDMPALQIDSDYKIS